MKHRNLLTILAWVAVLNIVVLGEAFAQVPSLVTQQTRLSTGGATPSYVQLRAKAGIGSSSDFYSWDQAPAPTAGVNYSLWLDANNNISRSTSFGVAQKGYLMQVDPATGNSLGWVDPLTLYTFNNAITQDPTTHIVQFGGPLVQNTSVDQSGFNLSFVNGSAATPTTLTLGNSATNAYNIDLDVGTGNMVWKDIAPDVTAPNIVALDATGNVRVRAFSTLITTDNGLTNVGTLISMGSPATGGAPLLTDRFISLSTHALNYEGSGNFNIGDGAGTVAIKMDPGAAGSIQMKNVANFATPTAADRFVMLDPTGASGDKVWTRSLSSLVNADNGLIVDNAVTPGTSTVQLGAPATGGALLLTDRFIGLASHALNIEGAGSINLGDGANAAQIKLDPGAAGFITAKNVANLPAQTATDRFVVLETGTDHAYTRLLNSLVNANNGLIVDNLATPGTSTVQYGSPATGGAPLLTDRFVDLSTHTMNYEGSGTVNIGTTGNATLNVNTGTTGNMTLQGTTLSVGPVMPNFTNIAFVDQTTNDVRIAKTADMTNNATPALYLTLDATGVITKSITPTAGISRGQIPGSGAYQYTSPALNIAAGASITATIENHTGVTGAIIVQVTNVVPGAAGTFSVETSESIQNGSFINYVVMNP